VLVMKARQYAAMDVMQVRGADYAPEEKMQKV
jgi:hypothetical protein